jgi:hypothetical protein
MGRMIRQMGFDTEVNTHCFSSCTLAFLGGVRRNVSGDRSTMTTLFVVNDPKLG